MSSLAALVERWRDDAGATYRTWFLWEVGRRRPEPFDLVLVEAANGAEQRVFSGATAARVEEATKGALVVAFLVDVRDPQLRLPEERVARVLSTSRCARGSFA